MGQLKVEAKHVIHHFKLGRALATQTSSQCDNSQHLDTKPTSHAVEKAEKDRIFGNRKTKVEMSVATSIPCLKIPNPSPSSSSPSASSSATSTASSCFRFSAAKTKPCSVTIRSSQADGPVRRPVAPPLKEPSPPSPPPSPVAPPPPKVAVGDRNVITLEFQRQKAKELQDYFKQKKLEEADQGPFFGFLGKNEIANGRWAMFGFAVGMLTEYATGSDFVDQVKILLSNFGIIDLE